MTGRLRGSSPSQACRPARRAVGGARRARRRPRGRADDGSRVPDLPCCGTASDPLPDGDDRRGPLLRSRTADRPLPGARRLA